MSYAQLLEKHVTSSLQLSAAASSNKRTCTIEIPEYFTQQDAPFIEQLFQRVCSEILFNNFILLDFRNTRSLDSYGAKVLAKLFQSAYSFRVGLGFINLRSNIELNSSLTGLDPT